MKQDKIQEMGEYVIKMAFSYAVENEITRNEAMFVLAGVYASFASSVKDDDTDLVDLKAKMISDVSDAFDAVMGYSK